MPSKWPSMWKKRGAKPSYYHLTRATLRHLKKMVAQAVKELGGLDTLVLNTA